MKKLILAFLAALCCTVMALAANTKATKIEYEPGKIMYFILDKTNPTNPTATVTWGGDNMSSGTTEYAGSITIPSTVRYGSNDYTVTSVGDRAFCQCTNMTSVTIPEGVTSIGDHAFFSCSSMTSVIIPSKVASIGYQAFGACAYRVSSSYYKGLTLMFQGDKPKDLDSDLFFYQWFDIQQNTLPEIVVCDEYKVDYTNFFGTKGHKIVLLSEFKEQVLNEIKGKIEELKNAGNLPEQVEAIIESCCSDIKSATTPGEVFTNKEIALLTINLSPQMQDVIAELNNLIENKVGLDIRRYITDICNATSKDQITEILNNAKEEISNSKTFTVVDKTYYLNHIGPDYTFYGNITFNDKDLYQSDYDFTVTGTGTLTYTRDVSPVIGKWQAWFVPFDLTLTSDDLAKFDAAQVAGVLTDNDGLPVIAFKKMKEGEKMNANIPYVIRPKSGIAQEISWHLPNPKFHSSVTTPFVIQSAYDNFTLGGIYEAQQNSNWYALTKDGVFKKMNGTPAPTLQPQRIWMTVTPREDDPYATKSVSTTRSNGTKSTAIPDVIRIVVLGDDGSPEGKSVREAKIINADGQSVNRIQRGQVYRISGNVNE